MKKFLTKNNHPRTGGFTLIEMLVVIAIIAILSAILYTNFSNAKKQARDKIRQSQLQELQVALELYKSKYGRYPERGCVTNQAVAPWWSGPKNSISWGVVCDEYILGLVPEFMEKLPQDPGNTTTAGSGIFYRTNATGSLYVALYINNVESLLVPDKGSPFARYGGAGCSAAHQTATYAIYSVGGECL
jgi:prepilin-type N-terminal cleavage/methylation domain-containing protein